MKSLKDSYQETKKYPYDRYYRESFDDLLVEYYKKNSEKYYQISDLYERILNDISKEAARNT